MGLIRNNVLSGIIDRVAAQAALYKASINSAVNAGTPYYKRVHTGVPADGDYTVENDLIDSTHAIDVNAVSGTMFRNIWTTLVQNIETHGTNNNAVSFNSWLNISGLNVHPDFEDVYFQVKNTHLDARNVFFSDANILAGTYAATGSGTGTFTAGTTIGTGAGAVSTTNHAAAKMVLVPVKETTDEIHINLRLVKENLAGSTKVDSANLQIAGSTISGLQAAVVSVLGDNDNFLSISNIVAAGGTSGDHFRVYALRERNVAL